MLGKVLFKNGYYAFSTDIFNIVYKVDEIISSIFEAIPFKIVSLVIAVTQMISIVHNCIFDL